MERKNKKIITVAVTLAAIGAILVLYFYNPLTAGFYPRCPSKLLTGFDCPGCGSLRALHSGLNGDFAAAWHYNPAVFFGLALLAMIGVASIHRTKPLASRAPASIIHLSRSMASVTDNRYFAISILVAVILWTVFRNII